MAYPTKIKREAIRLRKRGWSFNEISGRINVPKNTLSYWLNSIVLSPKAKGRLLTKIKRGQLVSAERKKKRTKDILGRCLGDGEILVKRIVLSKDLSLLLCSLIYWCEGAKDTRGGVRFTNSDQQLMKTFLSLLRASCNINENKFRVCLHLHSYHDPVVQLRSWSKVTGIPKKQFIKPFYKRNTGKRVRVDYNGCASLRYHDVKIARQLLMTAKVFLNKYGGVGQW